VVEAIFHDVMDEVPPTRRCKNYDRFGAFLFGIVGVQLRIESVCL
jgi:hypothetical protein